MIGTVMPPIAPNTGTASRLRSRSSPRSSWRLASRPTTRKNSVISPSLTQVRKSAAIPVLPTWIESSVRHTDSYVCHHGEFAHTSAAIAAPSMTNAPPASVLKKLRTGAARFLAHAVRPLNGTASVVTLIAAAYSSSGGSRRFELIWFDSASDAARWAKSRCCSSASSSSTDSYASAAIW